LIKKIHTHTHAYIYKYKAMVKFSIIYFKFIFTRYKKLNLIKMYYVEKKEKGRLIKDRCESN